MHKNVLVYIQNEDDKDPLFWIDSPATYNRTWILETIWHTLDVQMWNYDDLNFKSERQNLQKQTKFSVYYCFRKYI